MAGFPLGISKLPRRAPNFPGLLLLVSGRVFPKIFEIQKLQNLEDLRLFACNDSGMPNLPFKRFFSWRFDIYFCFLDKYSKHNGNPWPSFLGVMSYGVIYLGPFKPFIFQWVLGRSKGFWRIFRRGQPVGPTWSVGYQSSTESDASSVKTQSGAVILLMVLKSQGQPPFGCIKTLVNSEKKIEKLHFPQLVSCFRISGWTINQGMIPGESLKLLSGLFWGGSQRGPCKIRSQTSKLQSKQHFPSWDSI